MIKKGRVGNKYYKGEHMKISNCCYAPPLGEIYDDLGYCSECHKGAVFEEEKENENERVT